MIKYTLYIPPGCFYTQLKVFIGVKSTMNCNPSCPAATLLASLDCAYLYWPPPHRLLACFMSLSTFPLQDSDFWWTGEWQRVFYRKTVSCCVKCCCFITEVCFLNIAVLCLRFFLQISPVYVMLCFTDTLVMLCLAQSLSLSSQDCQQHKPNDWKLWPQNCYRAKLVQDWLIQIRTSEKSLSFF